MWDAATFAMALAAVATQVLFFHADVRLPRDMGRYYPDIPVYFWSLVDLPWTLRALADASVRSAGWYQFLIAGCLELFGRHPDILHFFSLFWYAAVLASTVMIARHLEGPRAGTFALALCAPTPLLTLMARTTWIHVPEAALVMTMLLVVVRDRTLSSRWTLLFLALLGAMTVHLRESGLIWTPCVLALVLIHAWPASGVARRRVVVLAVIWALAAVAPISRMGPYLASKVSSREVYRARVPELLEQVWLEVGVVGVALMAAGAASYFLVRRRQSSLEVLFLALWMLAPIPLFLLFRAGIDNFTLLVPAGAVVGACGFAALGKSLEAGPRTARAVPELEGRNDVGGLSARLRQSRMARAGLAGLPASLAVLVFVAFFLPQWLPSRVALRYCRWLPPGALDQNVSNYYRPYLGFGGPQVGALLDAACPSDAWRACHIVVERGLYFPDAEEYGLLELFLTANDRVELRSTFDRPPEGWKGHGVDALGLFECGPQDRDWRQRHPNARAWRDSLIDETGLQLAWGDRVGELCQFHWLTPGGLVRNASMLPATRASSRYRAWRPIGSGTNRRLKMGMGMGLEPDEASPSVWSARNPPRALRPLGWSAESVSVERAHISRDLEPPSSWYIDSITQRVPARDERDVR